MNIIKFSTLLFFTVLLTTRLTTDTYAISRSTDDAELWRSQNKKQRTMSDDKSQPEWGYINGKPSIKNLRRLSTLTPRSREKAIPLPPIKPSLEKEKATSISQKATQMPSPSSSSEEVEHICDGDDTAASPALIGSVETEEDDDSQKSTSEKDKPDWLTDLSEHGKGTFTVASFFQKYGDNVHKLALADDKFGKQVHRTPKGKFLTICKNLMNQLTTGVPFALYDLTKLFSTGEYIGYTKFLARVGLLQRSSAPTKYIYRHNTQIFTFSDKAITLRSSTLAKSSKEATPEKLTSLKYYTPHHHLMGDLKEEAKGFYHDIDDKITVVLESDKNHARMPHSEITKGILRKLMLMHRYKSLPADGFTHLEFFKLCKAPSPKSGKKYFKALETAEALEILPSTNTPKQPKYKLNEDLADFISTVEIPKGKSKPRL